MKRRTSKVPEHDGSIVIDAKTVGEFIEKVLHLAKKLRIIRYED